MLEKFFRIVSLSGLQIGVSVGLIDGVKIRSDSAVVKIQESLVAKQFDFEPFVRLVGLNDFGRKRKPAKKSTVGACAQNDILARGSKLQGLDFVFVAEFQV
jgi:hypothetical protein